MFFSLCPSQLQEGITNDAIESFSAVRVVLWKFQELIMATDVAYDQDGLHSGWCYILRILVFK